MQKRKKGKQCKTGLLFYDVDLFVSDVIKNMYVL